MKVKAFAASDRGKRRESNEDHYLIDESLGLYVICDGIGGHAAGEVAAIEAADITAKFIRSRSSTLENATDAPDGYFRVQKLAEEAVQEASSRLFKMARSNPQYGGMGTTMTLLLIVDSKGIMAHVGDSRLYLFRHGELHQLSSDHTLANELLHEAGLTQENEALRRYRNVLTRSVGRQELVQVDSLLFDLFPDDTCLLCSDGLSNYFDDQFAIVKFLQSEDLSTVPTRLVEMANSQGGADNISSIVLRTESDAEHTEAEDVQHCIDALKTTFLCHNLSVGRLMRVLNVASTVECAAGRRLLSVGQPCDGFYLLLDGRMLLEDDPVLSGEFLPGDCIGASSLLWNAKSHLSLAAEEPSRLLFISKTEFSKLTRRLPKLGNVLLRNLAEHLSQELDRCQNSDNIDPSDTMPWTPKQA